MIWRETGFWLAARRKLISALLVPMAVPAAVMDDLLESGMKVVVESDRELGNGEAVKKRD